MDVYTFSRICSWTWKRHPEEPEADISWMIFRVWTGREGYNPCQIKLLWNSWKHRFYKQVRPCVFAELSMCCFKMNIFSSEIQTAIAMQLWLKATGVMDSWLFPINELQYCSTPIHGFMWWDCCYYSKSMNYSLKVTDAIICLLITIPSSHTACVVFPCVWIKSAWSEPYNLLSPHLSSSSSSLKIKPVVKAWFIVWFIY